MSKIDKIEFQEGGLENLETKPNEKVENGEKINEGYITEVKIRKDSLIEITCSLQTLKKERISLHHVHNSERKPKSTVRFVPETKEVTFTIGDKKLLKNLY